jgi:Transposase.
MENTENKYVKRTQRDYSMSFKLSVVHEFENSGISLGSLKRKYGIQGDATIRNWIEKYGNFDVSNKCHRPMDKNKDQKFLKLEQKILLLERKNKRLEKELELKDMKAEFFDMMIDIAEKEYKIDIRKNSFPEQSDNIKK